MKTLWINACVRPQSRTRRLTEYLLDCLGGEVEELRLEAVDFPKVDAAFLSVRDALIAAGSRDDPLFALARQFAQAEQIVISAPYWDLSFPSSLKQYFEQINVLGIAFEYTPEGTPRPLCRAKRLFYVTTAGGALVPEEFGFGYVKALAQSFYGIEEVRLIQAAGLDIDGTDPERLLQDAMRQADAFAENPIAYCGVDCAACPDFAAKTCPGCRKSDWPDEDPCPTAGCCQKKNIGCCGRCDSFPCAMMRDFFGESDSHRAAYARMLGLKPDSAADV